MNALIVEDFEKYREKGCAVLDTRSVDAFKQGFIPGSVNIPVTSRLPEYATIAFKKNEPLILVTEPGEEVTAAAELKKAGIEEIAGFLNGSFEAWQKAGKPIDMIIDIEADELMMDIPFDENLVVIDVRRPLDFAQGHLKNAVNIPLEEMSDVLNLAQIEESDNLYLHCYVGIRSVIAASIIKKQGIHNLRNIAGGWEAIQKEAKAEIVKEPELLN
ncbi:rhodanese-like domain-containing protein [Niabella aquatica]